MSHLRLSDGRSVCGIDGQAPKVTAMGNCRQCMIVVAKEMAVVSDEVEQAKANRQSPIWHNTENWYCSKCNCNKSGYESMPNGITEACEDNLCLCHDEEIW